MFNWFMNDGFPEAAILDHNMTVFDLPPDYEPDYLNNQIQSALDNCDVCTGSNVTGDVNNDGMVNVVDVILTVNLVLATEFQASADINLDNTVNIVDIVLIVNIILGD